MLSSATKAAANVTRTLAENDLRTKARDVAHDLETNSVEMLHNVSGYASDAGQKVRGLFDKTVDQTRQASDKVTTEIKSNPVRASAIALGAGFILGALLTRR